MMPMLKHGEDLVFEEGKWYEFVTAFKEDTRLKIVRGKVTGIEGIGRDMMAVNMVRMHDAIPLFRLRVEYIESYREMSEAEVLAECL